MVLASGPRRRRCAASQVSCLAGPTPGKVKGELLLTLHVRGLDMDIWLVESYLNTFVPEWHVMTSLVFGLLSAVFAVCSTDKRWGEKASV